jgi:hypothetical protein
MLSIFGNTVAFDGVEDAGPGSGFEVTGTGIDVGTDLPPQPATATRKDEQRTRAANFDSKVKTPGRCTPNIPEEQFWFNQNTSLIPPGYEGKN